MRPADLKFKTACGPLPSFSSVEAETALSVFPLPLRLQKKRTSSIHRHGFGLCVSVYVWHIDTYATSATRLL